MAEDVGRREGARSDLNVHFAERQRGEERKQRCDELLVLRRSDRHDQLHPEAGKRRERKRDLRFPHSKMSLVGLLAELASCDSSSVGGKAHLIADLLRIGEYCVLASFTLNSSTCCREQ